MPFYRLSVADQTYWITSDGDEGAISMAGSVVDDGLAPATLLVLVCDVDDRLVRQATAEGWAQPIDLRQHA